MKWPFKKKEPDKVTMTNEDWVLLSRMMFRFINRDQNIPKIINMTDFFTLGYMYNPTVFSVISWRANAAKGVPWLVYKIKNTRKLREYSSITRKDLNLHKALALKEQSLDEVEGTPLNELLKRPNPAYSLADIIEALFVYRDVTGNSYLYQVDNPSTKEILQIHSLPADYVKIVGGTFLDPVKGYRFEEVFQDMLPPEKVTHWRYFNPVWHSDGRQLYGMSPLVAAARIINNDNSGIDNQTASFANEGVKGVIHGKNTEGVEYSKEQMEQVFKKWKKTTERAKAGEGNIGFSNFELGFLKVGETPVDLGVMDSRKFNKEILCNLFRIHPSLLSSDASTLNNLTEARKALMTMSVMPDLDSLKEHLNDTIQRAFGKEWYIDYDVMAIAELQDDIEKLGRTLQNMDWVSINEKRTATNYDARPEPWGNFLWSSIGKMPIGADIDTGFDEIDENLDKIKSNGLEHYKQ